MKRYVVIFEDLAQADVRESYDWGYRVWDKREAQQWLRQLRTAVTKQLRVIPKGFPLAPLYSWHRNDPTRLKSQPTCESRVSTVDQFQQFVD